MKKLYILLLTFAGVMTSYAQTFYSENVGTATGTVSIAANVFQNSTPIVYTGDADTRSTGVSGTYTGASAGRNVFFAATGARFFQIDGLNTAAYNTADLQISFGWLTSTAAAVITLETSTNGSTWTPVTVPANAGTGWILKTITGSVIPSSATLSLRFTAPATSAGMRIDDIKLINASASCTLVLGTPTALCDASTLGTDTYTATIPYTGGGAGTYSIVPNTGSVGGDNPNSVAAGNIVISGISEGTALSLNVTGSTCNLSSGIASPECKPTNALPYSESFPYTIGNSLGAEQKWTNVNTGDNVLVASGSLTYPGATTSGNSVAFDGTGIEARTPFTSTTTGTLYSSFLFSVPAAGYDNVTVDLTSTYFALFTDNTGGSINARVWIRKNGTQYQFGLSPTAIAADVVWSANLYNVATTQYLVLGYDFGANSLVLFENQATPSVPSVSVTPGTAYLNLGGFMLRQDAANTTPSVLFDELKISTTLPTLSRNNFDAIDGLSMYPNPLSGKVLNITSKANNDMSVAIYDLLGKEVLSSKVVNNAVAVANLTSGLYIVKITEGDKTATRKLIIE